MRAHSSYNRDTVRDRRTQYFRHMAARWERCASSERLAYRGVQPVPIQIGDAMGGFNYVRKRLPGGDYFFLPRALGGSGGLGIGWDGDPKSGNMVQILRMGPDDHSMEFFHTAYEQGEETSDSWGPSHELKKVSLKTYRNVSDDDLAKVFSRQTGLRLASLSNKLETNENEIPMNMIASLLQRIETLNVRLAREVSDFDVDWPDFQGEYLNPLGMLLHKGKKWGWEEVDASKMAGHLKDAAGAASQHMTGGHPLARLFKTMADRLGQANNLLSRGMGGQSVADALTGWKVEKFEGLVAEGLKAGAALRRQLDA